MINCKIEKSAWGGTEKKLLLKNEKNSTKVVEKRRAVKSRYPLQGRKFQSVLSEKKKDGEKIFEADEVARWDALNAYRDCVLSTSGLMVNNLKIISRIKSGIFTD